MLKKILTMLTAFAVALPVSAPLAPAAIAQETRLHGATHQGPDQVRAMLPGRDPNARDRNGETPLHWAMNYGSRLSLAERVEVVRLLIEAGADPMTPNNLEKGRHTPMHLAAHHSYAILKEMLKGLRSQVDVPDRNGHSPLYWALNPRYNPSDGTREEIIVALRLAGAFENYTFGWVHNNFADTSPLKYAIRNGQTDLLPLLQQSPPRALADILRGISPYESIANGNAPIDEVLPTTGESIMHIAAKENYLDIAREIAQLEDEVLKLDESPLVNLRDANGQTALHYAAARGHREMAEFLVSRGYDPDALDSNGQTAADLTGDAALRAIIAPFSVDPNRVRDFETGRALLHLRVMSGTLEEVREILSANARRNMEDNQGYTPAHLAVMRGDADILRALLSDGFSAAASLPGGPGAKYPAHLALENRRNDLLRILIEHDNTPIYADDQGDTLLHYAARTNNLEALHIMRGEQDYYVQPFYADSENKAGQVPYEVAPEGSRVFVRFFLDPYNLDEEGLTMLHRAALDEDQSLVSNLLAWGAQPDYPSLDGRTALHALVSRAAGGNVEDLEQVGFVIWQLLNAGADIALAWERTGTTPVDEAKKTEFGRENIMPALRDRLAEHATQAIADLMRSGQGRVDSASAEDIKSKIDEEGWAEVADLNELLRLAAARYGNRVDYVNLFLELGANANIPDSNGRNALHYAAANGNLLVVARLRGYDFARNGEYREDYRVAHDVSGDARGDYPGEVVPFAVAAEAARNSWFKIFDILTEIGFNLSDTRNEDPDGNTLMHHVALGYNPNSAVMADYLAREISDNEWKQNNAGKFPWQLAPSEEDALDIQRRFASRFSVQRMILDGYYPEILRELKADHRETASNDPHPDVPLLHLAVRTPRDDDRRLDVVRAVLEREGTDVNQRAPSGRTALHLAVRESDEDLIQLLLQNGARGDIRDNNGTLPANMPSSLSAARLAIMLDGGPDKIVEGYCGETRLHSAAKNRQLDNVRLLIDMGANLEAKVRPECEGTTPLYYTIQINGTADDGSLDVARALIQAGADLDVQSIHGKTALHQAVFYGHFAMVQLLLDAGANPDLESNGKKPEDYAPLEGMPEDRMAAIRESFRTYRAGQTTAVDDFWSAVESGDVAVLRAALPKVDPNMRREDTGDTALHEALRNNRAEIAEALLDAGADPSLENNDGDNALFVALSAGSSLVRRIAADLPKSAMLAARNKLAASGSGTPENQWELDVANRGYFALFSAVRLGRVDAVIELLEADYDIELRDGPDQEYTPLLLAVELGHADVALELIKRGADVNALGGKHTVSRDLRDNSLVIASMRGEPGKQNAELIAALLEAGAELHTFRPDETLSRTLGIGWHSPMHNAAFQGRADILNLLMRHGVSVNNFGLNQSVPLHAAVLCGADERSRGTEDTCVDAVRTLLEAGGDAWGQIKYERTTPTHYAVNTPFLAILELLNERGADWHLTDAKGMTPLLLARQNGSPFFPVILEWAGGLPPEAGNLPDPSASSAQFDGATNLSALGAADGGLTAGPVPLPGKSDQVGESERDDLNRRLITAAFEGTELEVYDLLRAGADPNYLSEDDSMPLHQSAICYGERLPDCVQKMILLLEHGADVNAQLPGNLDTALHLADHAVKLDGPSKLNMILLLLDHGADPSIENAQGLIPSLSLQTIAESDGNNPHVPKDGRPVEIARAWWVRLNPNLDGGYEGWSQERKDIALRTISRDGKSADVVALLEAGANPNSSLPGRLALQEASMCFFENNDPGCLEKANHLLDAGAEIDAFGELEVTALHIARMTALEVGTMDMALLLLARGADPRIQNGDGQDSLDILPRLAEVDGHPGAERARQWMEELGSGEGASNDPGAGEEEGENLIETLISAMRNNYSIRDFREVVERGVDVNALGRDGYAPLHHAAMCDLETRNPDCVDKAHMLLSEFDADANVRAERGAVALHIARMAILESESVEMALLLLEYDADPRLEDEHGQNALDVLQLLSGVGERPGAVRARQWMEELGLEEDADAPAVLGDDGEDLLGTLIGAIREGSVEDVRAMAAREGVDVNALGRDGFAPLHHAAICDLDIRRPDCLDKARILLSEFGAEVDVRSKWGDTALHPAQAVITRFQSADMALLLLEYGADPRIEDRVGNNALDILRPLSEMEGPGAERARQWAEELGL